MRYGLVAGGLFCSKGNLHVYGRSHESELLILKFILLCGKLVVASRMFFKVITNI